MNLATAWKNVATFKEGNTSALIAKCIFLQELTVNVLIFYIMYMPVR